MWIGPVEATISPCCAGTSDSAVGGSACVDAESADGDCKRPRYMLFSHIDTVSAGNFQTQRHKNKLTFVFFLKFNFRHKLMNN